jgi:galactokinase
VKKEDVDSFVKKLTEAYTKKTGLVPDFYKPEIGDGARRIG